MKKLLVLTLALVMAFSVAAVASAAEFSYSLGGDFYYYYQSKDKEPGFDPARKVVSADDTAVSWGSITAKVTEGNTWAKAYMHISTWDGGIGSAIHYGVGMDKIADVFSWQFHTREAGWANVGQAPLTEVFNRFRNDPFFNTYDLNGVLCGKVETDNVYVGVDVKVLNETEINQYAIGASFKFDGGDVHVGYKMSSTTDDATKVEDEWDEGLFIVGATYNMDEIKLAADFLGNAQHANQGELSGIYSKQKCNAIQANVAYQNINGTLLCVLNNSDNTDIHDNYFGLGASYTLDKWTVGAKYFNTKDATYEVYGLYDVGAFDVKLGWVNEGEKDGFAVLGVHASI